MHIIDSALSSFTSLGLDPDAVNRFITELASGNQDKVIRTGSASPWGLSCTRTAALEATVTPGLYVVSGKHIFVEANQVITFPGSSGNTYTLQGNLSGVVTKVIGVILDADNIKLWTVLDDDADINGDITDVRIFA